MIDFSLCEIDTLGKYEGSDQKRGIIYNGNRYMLKLSDRILTENRNSLNSSYSNSVFSEYICCHILDALGFDVQETLLGTIKRISRSGEEEVVPVVACKNFISEGYELVEFKKIEGALLDHKPPKIPDIDDIYEILTKDNAYFNEEKGTVYLEKYWDGFVLDALLGNFDRHADNWGYLIHKKTKEVKPAPIYDCGSCLYPQLADDKLAQIMNSPDELSYRLFKFPNACLTVNGSKASYYDYMYSQSNTDLSKALVRIFPRIDMVKIEMIINSTNELSDIRKTFYKHMLNERYHRILKPSFEKASIALEG